MRMELQSRPLGRFGVSRATLSHGIGRTALGISPWQYLLSGQFPLSLGGPHAGPGILSWLLKQPRSRQVLLTNVISSFVN